VTYAAAGVIVVWGIRPQMKGTFAGRASAASGLAAAVILATFPFGWMVRTYFPRATAPYAEDGSQLVETREGVSETIHLMEKSWLGKPLYYRLVTNGFSMSGTHLSGKRYMGFFAYLPMLLRPTRLQHVLVLCYGAGVTASAVTSIKSVDTIDVVEISPDVLRMSDIIYEKDHPLHDPRVRLHVEDARYFLQAATGRFDLITGEPPPPLTPGTVTLYSRDYFQLMREHLTEGGIATYWLPVARRGEYDVKAIIAAFCSVFEDCSLWNGTVFDWMLMGTHHLNGPASTDGFTSAWNDPLVWPRLREIGFELPQQVGATFLGDAADLRDLAGGAAPITDNYPQRLRPAPDRLALFGDPADAERDVSTFVSRVIDTNHARLAFRRSSFIRRVWPETLAAETLPLFDVQYIINRELWEGPHPLARIEELHSLLTRTTLRRPPLWALGSDDAQQLAADADHDPSGMVDYVLGIRALVARQYLSAAGLFQDAEGRGLRISTIRPLMVYSLCLAGRTDTARHLAHKAPRGDADQEHFWSWLASTFGVAAAD
jgi:spermidine synthase